jgi:hypothetical protein
MGPYISMIHGDNAVVDIIILHYNALNEVLFSRFEASLHICGR